MGHKMSDLYPSKYLKAEEFRAGEERVVTIDDLQIETFGEGAKSDSKPVLYFKDSKSFVLNKTNAAIIARLYGDDSDDWIGQRIQLFTMDVDSFGDIVRAIRVRPQVPKKAVVASLFGDEDEAEPGPATDAQIKRLKELAREFFGPGSGAKLTEMLGPRPDFKTCEEGINDLEKKVAAKVKAPVASFDDGEQDDSDPFADD